MDTYFNIKDLGSDLYSQINNNFEIKGDKTNCNSSGDSNNFGNYFQKCNNSSSYWGSNKPISDNCLKPQEGIPCNSLWNNSTRRKIIVDYNR